MTFNIGNFNWLDYVLSSIVAFSVILGLFRGFTKEIISLFTWLAAFFFSILFSQNLGDYFSQYMKSDFLAHIIGFICIFISILIIGALINYIVSRLVERSGHSIFNHLFGGIFGFLRGGLIILFIVFLISNTAFQERDWYQKSQLTYELQGASHWIQDHVIVVAKQKVQEYSEEN